MWKEVNMLVSSLSILWKHCLHPEFENDFMPEWKCRSAAAMPPQAQPATDQGVVVQQERERERER